MTQWCPSCRELVSAEQTEEHHLGMRISDRSECLTCGRVLWNWRYDPNAPRMVFPSDDHPSQTIPRTVPKVQLGLF